ncbi:uncharacterized protein LOC143275553 [Babylonia areolata]|uniref:uncharacterized protein LOC143275553 n=1 Tax=Babylonia areolata TaxID=304850 RepID=UPI003FD01B6C
MSDQGYNKVDLSLDDIIKLNKKEKQQKRATRGGSARGRSGLRGRGQGLRGGQRGRGAGRGRGGAAGTSPLNRQKTGTVSAAAALRGRGQGSRRRGQRGGGLRGIVGSRTGLRGALGGVRGQVLTSRGASVRGIRGNLRGRGARSSLRGSLRGQGSLVSRGQGLRGAQRQGQGRGQGATALNRISLKQKRQQALETLRMAQKTIAQLDQQTARQNFVNARRGIVQQQQQQQIQNQQPNIKKNQGFYSSTTSLVSNNPKKTLTSTRQLQGTQVTTFNPVSTQQSPRGRRRWRQRNQSSVPVNNGSTLTISIDNSMPLSTTEYSAPQVVTSTAPQQQRLRRRPWRRQNRNNNMNSNVSDDSNTFIPTTATTTTSADAIDFHSGASPEFSQQLMNMKPTVSTKYVFEKKAFSTGNTSYSLNDRFSSTSVDVLTGRKVFM